MKVRHPKVSTAKKVERPSRAEMADLFDGMVPAPEGNALDAVKVSVDMTLVLTAKIAEVEEMLANMKADLNQKLTKLIPDAMRAVNITEFVHESGVKVKIKDFLSGSIPKDPEKKKAAFEWLQKNDGGDLIRNKFAIELERGDAKSRKKVVSALSKAHVDYVEAEDVNHNSLLAFVRERMETGQPTPLDVLGIYAGVTTKIELPKEKKARVKAEPATVAPAKPKASPKAPATPRVSKPKKAPLPVVAAKAKATGRGKQTPRNVGL